MANIKIEIKINEEQSLIFDNEKILSFSTRSRTTSEPEKPVFNVFSSEATLVVKDDDLSLYNQGQQGLFDSYEYPAIISLNEVQIAKHKIIERPNYNYRDKTLTIQFGNSIDMFDELTYEGYTYPGIYDVDFPIKEQPLSAIFEHIFAKAFNITGSANDISDQIWGTGNYKDKGYFKTTVYDNAYDDYIGGSNYAYTKMRNIWIDYPYMPSKSFREAFSNVLARAKLSMVLNYDGYFKLVDMEKTLSDIISYGAVVIPNDYISSPFETSVILDNKYDNVQVSCSELITKIENKPLKEVDLSNSEYLTENFSEDCYVTSKTSYKTNAYAKPEDFSEWYRLSVVGFNSAEIFRIKDKNISINKYNLLSEILKVENFKVENIAVTCKYTLKKFKCKLNMYDFSSLSKTRFTPIDIADSAFEEQESFITLNTDFIINNRYYAWGELPSGDIPTVGFNIKNYFKESEYLINNSLYEASVSFPLGFNISLFVGYDNEVPKGNYFHTIDDAEIWQHIYEPISVVVTINGTEKRFDFNNSVVQKLGTSKNIATVDNCGEMLQYSGKLDGSEPVKYIEDIAGYYSNGLHTAKVKVIGGKKYSHKNGIKFEKPLFTMGDIVDIKGYDNNSIMKYPRTNMAINWQVVSNEFEFEGGACYQNLELKELPHYSQGLNFVQKEDGTGVYYSVAGIGECDDLNIIVPPIYMGRPVKEINNLRSETIESVSMPNTITTIGSQAFENCVKISQVSIPNSVTTIGVGAFHSCSSLTNITIPDSVTYIGGGAFQECSSLGKITLPFIGESTEATTTSTYLGHIFGATTFEDNSIYVPTSLTDVVITSATVIDTNAFYGCNRLQNITIPNTVTSVGENAFYGCSSLVYNKYSNCSYLGNNSNRYLYLAKAEKQNYSTLILPINCKIIGSYAFDGFTIDQLTIQQTTFIGKNAFYNCSIDYISSPNTKTWEASEYLSFSDIKTISFDDYDKASEYMAYNDYYLRKKS